MSARGLNVFVSIGAKLLPSINSAATGVERRFGLMSRRLRVSAAETKAAYREVAGAAKPLLALAAAGGLSMGLKGIFGAGIEYRHEIAMMRNMGRSTREIADSIAAANRTIADVPTSSLTDSLKILNETTLAYGGLSHAMENLTFNSKMGSLMKGIMGPDYDEAGGFNQLVRALELRSGKMNAVDYQRQANGLFRAIVASSGTVNPEQFLGFMQQAGVASRGWNESFLTRVAPSLIQEFGGERAGTAATALFNQFMGRVSVGGKSITEEWVRLGLVPPKGTGGNLSKQGWSPGSLKNNALAMADPLAYVEQVIFPALKAHGVDTNNRQAMILQAQKMFGRETGKRLASTLFDPAQLNRIHADMSLYDKASGVDKAYSSALYNDPRMAQMAAANSLHNLETMLGKSVTSPAAIKAIVHVANAINSIAGVFDRHPGFARGVVLLTGLGAAAATLSLFGIGLKGVGSAAMLLARGFGFLVPLGTMFLNGMLRLAPFVIRGMILAFELLSNPVGWAIILVGVAAALIYYFRADLARAFPKVVAWFRNAWTGLKNWLLSVNWAAVGMSIANALTFGLVDKFKAAFDNLKKGVPAANVGMDARGGRAGGLAGARAGGGRVSRGRSYLVGERGEEVFTPGADGFITSNRHLQGALAGSSRGGPSFVINVNGATDPAAVARHVRLEVERALGRHADNSALLSD